MNTIFDIETISLSDEKLIKPEFVANKTLKDPEKIKVDLAAKELEWRDRLALDATTGSIAMIGYLTGDEVEIAEATKTSEAEILESFWTYAEKKLSASDLVIGFNSARFDLPFMVRRSWANGVPIPAAIRKGRYWADGLVDLMDIYACGNREQTISLANLCKFLGVGEKTGNGADFGKLTNAQQVEYLTHDLKLTAAVAKRLLP